MYHHYLSAAAHLINMHKSISDNLGDVDAAGNLLVQSPSSVLKHDDNIPNESVLSMQSSNDQMDSEKDQSDTNNYEMPIATIVNDEEVALPHAEPAQIDDDIIIVDAKVCLITK